MHHRRFWTHYQQHLPWDIFKKPKDSKRITVWDGNITQPQLGLNTEALSNHDNLHVRIHPFSFVYQPPAVAERHCATSGLSQPRASRHCSPVSALRPLYMSPRRTPTPTCIASITVSTRRSSSKPIPSGPQPSTFLPPSSQT